MKIVTPLLLTLLSLTLAAGCGGGDSETASPAGESPNGTDAPDVSREEPPDLADVSLVDNLLAKEADGEWTREEGLVASLRMMANELDAAEVLRDGDVLEAEGTGILWMANDYLQTGSDAGTVAEIERLFDVLVFSGEQLERMAGLDTVAGLPVALDVGRSQQEEDCAKFFQPTGNPPAGVGPCVEAESITIGEDTYRVFFPFPLPAAGWSQEHVDLVIETLKDSDEVYGKHGLMPDVNVVLSVASAGKTLAAAYPWKPDGCGVVVYTTSQTVDDGDFKQILAHELAHCFSFETFPEQNELPYEVVQWREEGVAEYLSNLVYPSNNFEWRMLNRSELSELVTTVLTRPGYFNFIWFQYLANELQPEGLLDLIEMLPTSGGLGDQEAALANAHENMAMLFQQYTQDLTDSTIQDTGGLTIPYLAQSHTVAIAGEQSPVIEQDLEPFRVTRLTLSMIDETGLAELDYVPKGLVLGAAKSGASDEWTSVPQNLPSQPEECGIVVVVTAIEPESGYALNVPGVQEGSDRGCDPCLFGSWTLRNEDQAKVLSEDPAYNWSITGTLGLRLAPGGQATWTLSSWTQTWNDVAGPDPGDTGWIAASGSGAQRFSVRNQVLSFTGPEVEVSVTEAGHDQVLQNFLDVGLGDIQTDFLYECDGDLLTVVRGASELGFTRDR